MANSRRYLQLTRRISVIKSFYFPVIRSSGNYSLREQDDLRAYLLLVHAEMESYLEDIATEKVKTAVKKWKSNRQKSNVLLALLSFCEYANRNIDLELRINKSLSLFINKLKNNNGLKEKNILDILLPIGIENSNLDSTWLSIMDSFGLERGSVAHSTASVQAPLDPKTLEDTISLIVVEIARIDAIIKSLK